MVCLRVMCGVKNTLLAMPRDKRVIASVNEHYFSTVLVSHVLVSQAVYLFVIISSLTTIFGFDETHCQTQTVNR